MTAAVTSQSFSWNKAVEVLFDNGDGETACEVVSVSPPVGPNNTRAVSFIFDGDLKVAKFEDGDTVSVGGNTEIRNLGEVPAGVTFWNSKLEHLTKGSNRVYVKFNGSRTVGVLARGDTEVDVAEKPQNAIYRRTTKLHGFDMDAVKEFADSLAAKAGKPIDGVELKNEPLYIDSGYGAFVFVDGEYAGYVNYYGTFNAGQVLVSRPLLLKTGLDSRITTELLTKIRDDFRAARLLKGVEGVELLASSEENAASADKGAALKVDGVVIVYVDGKNPSKVQSVEDASKYTFKKKVFPKNWTLETVRAIATASRAIKAASPVAGVRLLASSEENAADASKGAAVEVDDILLFYLNADLSVKKIVNADKYTFTKSALPASFSKEKLEEIARNHRSQAIAQTTQYV